MPSAAGGARRPSDSVVRHYCGARQDATSNLSDHNHSLLSPLARHSAHSQQLSPLTLNAHAFGTTLAANPMGHWVRIVVERFNWKVRAVQHKKSRKSWDAVRQLDRNSEVVGGDEPISVQVPERGDLFRDGPTQPEELPGSD